MKKILLICSLTCVMLLVLPSVVTAVTVAPGIEQMMDDDINITVHEQTVYISGAQGQTLEVVSLTGRRIMSVKIESNIPKGCYILKIGKVVRKVSIR